MTEQLLVRLPGELVRRFKRAVAPRQRSKFVERLLEQALPPDEVSDIPFGHPRRQCFVLLDGERGLVQRIAGAERNAW